jgi:two-component system LytT family response regulator
MMLKCLAIDDEPLALDLIASFIEKTPFLELVGRCENALEGIELLNDQQVDLIFLDIEMPDINGIQFLNSLQQKPMVIFTTAYEQYALEGFDLDVVDYLLKPIPFDRFVKASNKAKELHELRNKPAVSESQKEFLFVKADYQITKITIADIVYIEGLKDYIKIVLPDNKKILTLQSLKAIEEELKGLNFMRIHRSFIVPLHKIDSIRKNSIKIGEDALPIGEKYKEEFTQRLNIS